jgi:hypothetical protein
MDRVEALKAIRTLINVASESGDIDFIYKQLRQMRNIVNKAIPAPTLERRKKTAAKRATIRLIK